LLSSILTGSNITLSCSSSVPWFFCLWNSPRNEKQCAIQEDEVRGVCSKGESSSPSLPSSSALEDDDNDSHLSVYKLSGARHQCSLFVDKVTRHMHGDWMCLLNEISQFNSVKHTVQLKVGVETQLSWKVMIGQDERVHNSPILHLTEGDHVSIACVAAEGFPVMQFSWEHHIVQQPSEKADNSTRIRTGREYKDRRPWDDSTNSGILNQTRKAVYSVGSGSHLYSGSQTIDYVANLTHNASVLVCKTNQKVDDENPSDPMYSSSIALTLDIAPIVIISSNTHLHERLGVISGIILAIIFIILIFILLSIFLTRRRKADKKYSSLTDKSSDELLKPIWVPGKASKTRVHVGAAREYVNEYQQFGEGRELSDCSVPVSGRARGREVALTQDTDLRHCHSHSHDHHDTRHLDRMVYVKQSPGNGSSNTSPEYQNIPHSHRVENNRHGHVCLPNTCTGRHVYQVDPCLDVPETVLDISVETHSEHSSTEHSRNMSTAASVSRPTTRTTKTISDGSDSSRSSVLLDKSTMERQRDRMTGSETDNVESFLRGASDNVESYISFQSDIRDHSDAIYSPNSTINSDKISGIVTDTEYPQSQSQLHHHLHHRCHSAQDHHSCDDSTSVSLLHETHFGDSLTDIPRTVISAIPHTDKISQSDLERITKRYSLVKLKNTIFDCEEGCFISFEEFEKRISQESLNKIKE